MTDANELLERIRKAQDWADKRAHDHRRAFEAETVTDLQDFSLALAYHAVSKVLGEIVQPPKA
jgi:hypothetical protein